MAYSSDNYAGPRGGRKRPPVVGESAADKVPVANPAADRLRTMQAERDRKVAARPKPNITTRGALSYHPAASVLGLLAFQDPNLERGFRSNRDWAKRQLDTLMDPAASRREKVEAAGGVGSVGGALNWLPGRKVKPPTPAPRPVFFHVAPRSARPAIEKHGLTTGFDGSDPVHVWDNAKSAREWAAEEAKYGREVDIWEIDATDINATDGMYEKFGHRIVADGVGAERLSLHGIPQAAPAPRPAGAEKVIEAMPEARRQRAAQDAGYKVERGKRGGESALEFERAGGGQAGHLASKAPLKGELTKLPFGRLMKEYGAADSELRAVHQPQVDEMMDFITAHPSLEGRPLAAVGAREALQKALDGVTPQKAEIRTLEKIFGEEAVEHFKWRAARERALKLANIPRSLQASYDLSLNLRQLLVAGVRHPVLWQRVFRAQVKAARSREAAVAMLDEIRARPRYDQMIDDGVKLTDIRAQPGRLEEDFIGSEYAEKIWVVGRGVRWSTRAFTVGGAKMRADLYDLFMDQAEKAGKTLTKKERQALASVINAGTGRGGMGLDVLEKAAPLGTVLLFSPRLIASRLAFFNPVWYARLALAGGPAAKEAVTSLVSVLALGSSVLWLAKELGAAVEDDPRSADFGKIQVGDTRVDIWGGFQQYAVNGFRYVKGETKTPDGKVKSKNREEILWNFASGKAAPLPGLARDLQRGRTFDYQPVDAPFVGVPYGSAVGKLFVPFGFQNAWDAKHDPKLAAASFGLGGLGLGVQTYSPDDDKKKGSGAAPPGRPRGSYRSSRTGRYQGGPGHNYAGPQR